MGLPDFEAPPYESNLHQYTFVLLLLLWILDNV